MVETRSTCPYCGVGCGVVIQADGVQITGVRGDPAHPANFGRLCTKGATLHLTASAEVTRQTRLLQPMQRLRRGAAPSPVTWDAALGHAADRFAQIIQAHGPDAVGFYLSGQLLTEDYYVFNKLAKGLIGTNNLDTNSRLCMSSAVAGYKQTLGADAPPACYDDLNHADCLFIAGSNTAWAHPVLFRRIEDARQANPALKIVVVDPRRTDTCEIADLHLPLKPGSDVTLFHGMLHVMVQEGWIRTDYIDAHTRHFAALRERVAACTPQHVAQVCGLRAEDLHTAARWFATSPATLSLYCMGLNQSAHGTANNAALINLHLATAQIGRPGAGPFSLTGQPNAMGGREVGGLSNLLPAHRDMANPAHRAEVAALWGVPSVPGTPGKSAIEMFRAAADGEIKALWIACTNPAQSMPDQATVRHALQRAELVVVQEAFADTATCAFADVLLPATTWGEKEGTVTNSERRISRVRAAAPAPGQARHDWAIGVDLARRLAQRLGRGQGLFPYEQPETIWSEHRASTRGRDLDITGMSYALLEAAPQQWPLREGQTQGQARLYEDGVFPTEDGRARFADVPEQGLAEPPEARYPLSLTTGRLRDQWHGMSRTGTLGQLFGHAPEPVLQMHPQDMAARALQEGDLVQVSSRHGSLIVPVAAGPELAHSQSFMAMHWGAEFLGGRSSTGAAVAGVNALTTPAHCPVSKQPELKHVPIQVTKAELPWTLLAMAWLPADAALTLRRRLRDCAEVLPFFSCVSFADGAAGQSGVQLRAAAQAGPPEALLAEIEHWLGLDGSAALRYVDARRGQRRALRLTQQDGHSQVAALLLAGDTRAGSWLRTLLKDRLPAEAYGARLLAAQASAPAGLAARGKVVCNCLGVSESAIATALDDISGDEAQRLAQLQARLRCGTQCGSCLPELKRMVRATVPA